MQRIQWLCGSRQSCSKAAEPPRRSQPAHHAHALTHSAAAQQRLHTPLRNATPAQQAQERRV
jgi:hypothetical protein